MSPDGTPAAGTALAERVAGWAAELSPADVPDDVRRVVERALLDVAGLCLAARETDYVAAVRAAWPETGPCTAFGHAAGSCERAHCHCGARTRAPDPPIPCS